MADTRDTTTKCRGDRFITEDGGMSGVMCPGCEKCKHLKPMKRLPDEPSNGERPTTPDELREIAQWFDNPNETPSLAIRLLAEWTPGYLLRRIAEELEGAP